MAKKAMINKQQKPAKFSTRAYTRCSICGRPHAVLRKYGICRICFRNLAYKSDSLPLFSKSHKWGGANNGTQSNYFYGDIFSSGEGSSRKSSTEVFEEALGELSVMLRNMKDENGDPLGYTADTIILPGNRPIAETIAKKVCGSPGALGNGYNDINLHYGNWNVVILPNWQTSDDRVMIMSSEANKNLSGNMFFNRVPLTISSWVDNHTGNYIWNGRCRFGVGFGTYKHILLAVDSASALSTATKL